jgi:hypothetical protein
MICDSKLGARVKDGLLLLDLESRALDPLVYLRRFVSSPVVDLAVRTCSGDSVLAYEKSSEMAHP